MEVPGLGMQICKSTLARASLDHNPGAVYQVWGGEASYLLWGLSGKAFVTAYGVVWKITYRWFLYVFLDWGWTPQYADLIWRGSLYKFSPYPLLILIGSLLHSILKISPQVCHCDRQNYVLQFFGLGKKKIKCNLDFWLTTENDGKFENHNFTRSKEMEGKNRYA